MRGEALLDVARLFNARDVPVNEEELRSITGVGSYTSAAWLSLHRDQRAVMIDSNIFRWLARMTGQPISAIQDMFDG